MNEAQLRALMEQVREGAIDVDGALARLRHMPFEDLGFAKVDQHRALAQGMPEVMGNEVETIHDIGVAGIHRLMNKRLRLTEARVIVVCAGMEGALPSVVGGLVSCPVIAVPTSVGYGASFHGLAALLGMLNSCASNVTVVNIDNVFGAAYVASF